MRACGKRESILGREFRQREHGTIREEAEATSARINVDIVISILAILSMRDPVTREIIE